jgi:hypothetical protein
LLPECFKKLCPIFLNIKLNRNELEIDKWDIEIDKWDIEIDKWDIEIDKLIEYKYKDNP